MSCRVSLLWVVLAAPALASPISVTLTGNFGAPSSGSSVFDNQNYTISFVIPDPSSPSAVTCCLAQISAGYNVTALFAAPGIGLSLDNSIQAQYYSQLPLGQWLNLGNFTGLPVGDFMLLTPFQINTGQLWNGLAGALGTPSINLLNAAPGTGTWHLEQNSTGGPIPIAVYQNGTATLTAQAVPEPALVWMLGGALLGIWVLRRRAA